MKTSAAKPTRFIDTQAAVFLDLLRGLAALIVLTEHFRLVLFVGYNQIPGGRSKWALLYTLGSAGHQAVVVFFVLSGYLISGSIFRLLDSDRWSWRLYLTHRLVRLWIVLLPGLVLGLLWDRLGLYLNRAPATYSGGGNVMIHDVAARLSLPILFANATFLQTIQAPTLGSNGALWSLANEFWYYILFPCLLLACLRMLTWQWRIVAGIAFVVVALFVGPDILLRFPIWLMGTALVFVKPKTLPRWVRGLAPLLYIAVFFALAKPRWGGSWKNDTLMGAVTTLFIWTLLCAQDPVNHKAPWATFSRTLARFSFSLYVLHTPFLLLLASIILRDTKWQPSGLHLVMACGFAAVVLAYAYLIASLTEFRTDAVRKRVEALIVPHPARSQKGRTSSLEPSVRSIYR